MNNIYKKYLYITISLVVSYYIVLFSVNFVVDPFNLNNTNTKIHFDKKRISIPYNHILYNINTYKYGSYTKVIFGDSRGKALHIKYFTKYDDDQWFNFSFGQANILEIIDSVYYAVKQKDIDEVLITIPFRVFVDRDINRFPEALELISNPPLYYTNTLVIRASIANILYLATGKIVKTQKQGGTKKAAWQYWLNHARNKAHAWSPARRILIKLNELFTYLQAHEIKYTVFLPPIHKDILNIYMPVIGEQYIEYVKFLTTNAATLDCTKASIINDYNSFRDPYHFNQKNAEIIIREFINKKDNLCIYRSPTKLTNRKSDSS